MDRNGSTAGFFSFLMIKAGREWLRSFGRFRWSLPLDDNGGAIPVNGGHS
ncbi:MAG: hypothetical protein WAO23_06210 [Dethiobacteria bacterium]